MLDEAVFMAGDLMTRDVAVVHPESSLLEAVKLMAQRRISGVPVVDDAGGSSACSAKATSSAGTRATHERQARWLDMLADGCHLAPEFLDGHPRATPQGEDRDVLARHRVTRIRRRVKWPT